MQRAGLRISRARFFWIDLQTVSEGTVHSFTNSSSWSVYKTANKHFVWSLRLYLLFFNFSFTDTSSSSYMLSNKSLQGVRVPTRWVDQTKHYLQMMTSFPFGESIDTNCLLKPQIFSGTPFISPFSSILQNVDSGVLTRTQARFILTSHNG